MMKNKSIDAAKHVKKKSKQESLLYFIVFLIVALLSRKIAPSPGSSIVFIILGLLSVIASAFITAVFLQLLSGRYIKISILIAIIFLIAISVI